jgi:hypothetical protein
MIDDEETTAVFERLRALKRELRSKHCSQRDTALIMIEAIISEGVNTRTRIIGAADRLGFSKQFIAKLLDEGCLARWQRLADGRYVVGPPIRSVVKPLPDGLF